MQFYFKSVLYSSSSFIFPQLFVFFQKFKSEGYITTVGNGTLLVLIDIIDRKEREKTKIKKRIIKLELKVVKEITN